MASNDPKKGGSFYLQSKVYRAKELLDEFQREKREEELQQQQQQPPQQGEDGGTGGGANR
jgi:mitochondrial import inner membrane translocase subunit TIM16